MEEGRPAPASVSSRGLRALVLIAVALLAVAASGFLYLRPAPIARHPAAAIPPADGGSVLSFAFFDQSAGWAVLVGRAGVSGPNTPMSIVRTSDGGRHWKRANVPGVASYMQTKFFDATHGIVWTRTPSGPILYSTADGGQHWRSLKLPGQGNDDFASSVFLDPRRGWYLEGATPALPNLANAEVSQQPFLLWRTLDGGATWSQLLGVDAAHPSAGGLSYDGFKSLGNFSDERHGSLGWAPSGLLGSAPSETFYVTADGGQSWTPLAVPSPPDALVREASRGMSFRLFRLRDLLVELVGAAAPSGLRYFTRVSADGGASWTALRPLPIGPVSRLVLPQFEDSRHWSIAADRLLWVSPDAGETWQSRAPAIPASLSMQDLQVVGRGVIWAVGAKVDAPDYLLRSRDGGVHWEDQGPPSLQLAS
ncbi:hypothetical protein [Candidatus Nephthysia bennettiae]|uniref:Photosynthesis system II assembly factor Ycf48/Hcf136-like domain-containing protein n=1 Tax=Candidatus Nephthysia bennettiae TaxID=3127016 RepID=A0A934NBS3_9BACT|nr:hypothetical protein [Candidatus Dormibacteraeota bacterium]MBJ7607702.1 hypothetical protein [Candidatus Dormibacteraeota bacterium]MBJ7612593.1 hypothetical protein [Candidatus Dormibacteraeota bacterium]